MVCPKVSVIIPTYNSAGYLKKCLDSVSVHGYACKEIIVVDNYSADKTRDVATSYGATVVVFESTQAAARNLGIRHATGKYVLFLDADQRLGSSVVEDCVSLCASGGVEAVKIPEVFVGENFWGRCSALWKNSVVKAAGSKGGIPRFYAKSVLVRQNGFNERSRWWEDQELYNRLRAFGLREAWCNCPIAHFESGGLEGFIRKYLSYGKSVTAFGSDDKVPYSETLKLTLSTLKQVVTSSGDSLAVFAGCLFLFGLKNVSGVLGFVSAKLFGAW